MDYHTQSLGRVIARRRDELGLTQREVAESLGYRGPQFISNIERGVAGLPITKYRHLARALSMGLDELLEESLPADELGAARQHFGLDNAAGRNAPGPCYLPMLAEVKCSSFTWADSFEDDPEQVAVPPHLYRPGRFLLQARGDSMAKEIKDGDVCVFDPTRDARSGSIICAQLTGEAEGSTIKWYIDHRSYVELRPENISQLHPPLVLFKEEDEFLYEGDKRVQLLVKGVLVGMLRRY